MKRHLSYFSSVNIALVMAVCYLFKSNAQPSTNLALPPPGFANRSDYMQSLTNEAAISAAYQGGHISKDEAEQVVSNRVGSLPYRDADSIYNAYHHGLIGKGEAMILDAMRQNRQVQNLYGRVIDQNGQPVAGAVVEGCLEMLDGLTVGKVERPTKQTDADGLFQFIGLKGANLSASVSKPGYEIDYRVGRIAPVGGQSSSNDRVTFVMCKLHGAEPMTHSLIDSDVSCDGSVKRFNLLTGMQNNTGDLMVTLNRSPLTLNQDNRHKPFEWSVTFAITNGGLQEITNIYPNDAPADGYQPAITLNFPTNIPGWQYRFRRSYYFKSQGDHVYGRMTVEIDASRPQPPTYFSEEIFANPSGSRNLEFDPQKQIH